jgi:hypothetical protein
MFPEDGPNMPDALPFADWPRGDRPPASVYGRAKIPVDKAYTAHWRHCGNGLAYAPLEQIKARAKPNTRMYLPPISRQPLSEHIKAGKNSLETPASPRPATIRLTHTQLNRAGWRERMVALNAASIGKEE